MTRNYTRHTSLVIAATALTTLGLTSVPAEAQDGGPDLHKTKCAACHGAAGKGDTAVGKADKIRDMSSADVQQESDDYLTTVITSGKVKMPAYAKSLKPDQVKDRVAYIRSLATK